MQPFLQGVFFVLTFIVWRQFGAKRKEFLLKFYCKHSSVQHIHTHNKVMGAMGANEGT